MEAVLAGGSTVGREDDKNEIITLLTKPSLSDSQNCENISVISVVGMEGLGKTTLVQLVYDDALVKEYFETRMWVCVSNGFCVATILVKILECITQKEFNNVSDVDVLTRKARELLSGKKYLLVLDDLSSEDASKHWETLKNMLQVGAQGSTILVTTRETAVSEKVNGSIPSHELKRLTKDECWSIIAKKAFSDGGAAKTPRMRDIGKEIAQKCCGLPLAAECLGRVMHRLSQESDWLSIKANATEDIKPILKLSYDCFSPHLKRCFSYCSIFPKAYAINRETLIQLWTAEGFIPDEQDTRSKEDIGNEYFESLLSCSFFKGVEKNEVGDIKTCRMHDLVHDFAQAVVGDQECISLKVSDLTSVSGIHRLRLTLDEELLPSFTLHKAKKLRTVIILEASNSLDLQSFKSNEQLRVLYLRGLGADLSELSKWSGELKQLRYLNLTSFNLRKVKNDKSIDELYLLETLVLSRCRNVLNLLKNVGSLENLRSLDISFTGIDTLPDAVTSLRNLQRLDLNNCSSLTTFPNSITGLNHLKYLDMSCTPIEKLPGFISSLHNLETLDVRNCQRLTFLAESVEGLDSLRVFIFIDCPQLEVLPQDFGALTRLRYLDVTGCKIKVLPESCDKLSNLEIVDLSFCEPPKEVTSWKKLRTFTHMHPDTPEGIRELVRLECLVYYVTNERGVEEVGSLDLLEALVLSQLRLTYVHDRRNGKRNGKRANLTGKRNLRVLTLDWNVLVVKYAFRFPIYHHGLALFFLVLLILIYVSIGVSYLALFGFVLLYIFSFIFKNRKELLSFWFTADFLLQSCTVLEDLKPPASLEKLAIHNFKGWFLPTWMCDPSCLPNLVTLELIGCDRIKQLPADVWNLPRLGFLDLRRMSLKSLDMSIPWLHDLQLMDMLLLEELTGSFPRLEALTISNCSTLTKVHSFHSLKTLLLMNIDQKTVSLIAGSQTCLANLMLENIEDLVFFPMNLLHNNRNLQRMTIEKCNLFQGFQASNYENEAAPNGGSYMYSGCLQTLTLIDCPVLKFLPDSQRWASMPAMTITRCPLVQKASR